MIDKIIIDTDLCIKLGGHKKYTFLYDILPLVADKIYMHTHAHGEVLMPSSAVQQLSRLTSENKVVLVNESNLDSKDRAVYDAAYKNLAKVMINPNKPNKNKGEACSLAYAKATGIPVFATDEKDLQSIIDKQLNTGIPGIDIPNDDTDRFELDRRNNLIPINPRTPYLKFGQRVYIK